MVGRLKMIELHRRAKYGRNRPNRGRDMTIFRFFQNGGRPPSWICYVCVWTTHEGHLVVFVTVQNLDVIDAVVLIICMFFDFTSLAWKRLFTPPKLEFWGILLSKWEQCRRNPKKHILARVRVAWAIMRENPSTRLTCRWVPRKGIKEFKKFSYISPIRPEPPRGRMCIKFGTAIGVADVITCDNQWQYWLL